MKSSSWTGKPVRNIAPEGNTQTIIVAENDGLRREKLDMYDSMGLTSLWCRQYHLVASKNDESSI